jgi:hypothetical protein
MLLSLGGCSFPTEAGSPDELPSPVVEARSTPLVRREPGPLELAGLQLEQTRAQLKQIPTDPEFNGYHQIVKIAEQEEGLLYFHSLLGDDARFFAELERLKTEDASPLRQDLSALMSALEKPVVWAPIKVEDGGARQAAEAKKFEAVISALIVVPKIYSRTSDLEERLQADLKVLGAGRKIATDARTMDHYRVGLSIQEKALDDLLLVLRSGKLGARELRDLVTGLQMQVGSPQELTRVLDTEYLLATERLAAEGLEPGLLASEQSALASRYLKMRPHFTESTPPPGGFVLAEEIPETGVWVKNQPDFLVDLGRSREAATRLAATELQAALEAFWLKQGVYPESLEDLVPAYLSRIPENTLSRDGKFVYERTAKDYRLEGWKLSTSRPSSSPRSTPSPGSPSPSSSPEPTR